jgi:hypothetical protein
LPTSSSRPTSSSPTAAGEIRTSSTSSAWLTHWGSRSFSSFEFISYAQLAPDQFLGHLSSALQSLFGSPFADLYPDAVALFRKFAAAKHRNLTPSGPDEFDAAMRATSGRGQRLPAEPRARAEYLVRRLLGPDPEIDVLSDLRDWSKAEYP